MLFLLLTPLILFLAVYAFWLLVFGVLSRLDEWWLKHSEPKPFTDTATLADGVLRPRADRPRSPPMAL